MAKNKFEDPNRNLFEEPLEDREKLADLENNYPDILSFIRQLQDPSLTRKEFFQLIWEFNARIPGNEKIEGTYNSIVFEAEGRPKRRIKVSWFHNERVEIIGEDSK